jgi:hypothetical protein
MHVKEGLQKAYSAEIPKGVLEVFCVSNTSYEKYAMKGDIEMVQASGIPEVRQFCYTIISHAHLLEANHFRNSRMSSFLNSTLLVVAKPACQTMEAMIDRSIYFTLFGVKNEVCSVLRASCHGLTVSGIGGRVSIQNRFQRRFSKFDYFAHRWV